MSKPPYTIQTIQGRGALGGSAEGKALISRQTISGWDGIDIYSGRVKEPGHPLENLSINDTILILDKIKHVHDTLKQKSAACGIAALGFHNSGGIVTLAPWADGLARQDLIGIAMFNGGSRCTVPHGGTQGVFGTNPLAYAIPTDGDSICLDMATSEIPFFEVKNAKQDNVTLKPGAAVDPMGIPTTDPQKALSDDGVANLLTMGGGFKGYGIVMLIELLTGSLVRSLLSTRQTPGWNPGEYGCLLIAIHIGTLTDLSEFKRSVADMCTTIRDLPVAAGQDSVSIPGDRGHARVRAALQEGSIDIDEEVYDALITLHRNTK